MRNGSEAEQRVRTLWGSPEVGLSGKLSVDITNLLHYSITARFNIRRTINRNRGGDLTPDLMMSLGECVSRDAQRRSKAEQRERTLWGSPEVCLSGKNSVQFSSSLAAPFGLYQIHTESQAIHVTFYHGSPPQFTRESRMTRDRHASSRRTAVCNSCDRHLYLCNRHRNRHRVTVTDPHASASCACALRPRVAPTVYLSPLCTSHLPGSLGSAPLLMYRRRGLCVPEALRGWQFTRDHAVPSVTAIHAVSHA